MMKTVLLAAFVYSEDIAGLLDIHVLCTTLITFYKAGWHIRIKADILNIFLLLFSTWEVIIEPLG